MNFKNGLAFILFFLAIFLVSGGASYLFALSGFPVAEQDVVAFTRTPVALFLILLGSFGLLILSTLPKQRNPKTKAWLKLVVYFGMVILAWIYLELLLTTSYTKQ